MVPDTGYSDIGFYSSYRLQYNRLPLTHSLWSVGLRSSTTADKAFQHVKAELVITKSVFKFKMVGDNFETFDEVFRCFV